MQFSNKINEDALNHFASLMHNSLSDKYLTLLRTLSNNLLSIRDVVVHNLGEPDTRHWPRIHNDIEHIHFIANQNYVFPSIEEIKSELKQIARDFGIDASDNHCLYINMDKVYFEDYDMNMGQFYLILYPNLDVYIECMDHNYCYDGEIFHPHVRNGELCLGDGGAAAERAASSFNLVDLCQIYKNVLHTYSPESPYVPLENWDDPPETCSSCDYEINSGDSYGCDDCGTTVCSECMISSVNGCEHCYCPDCINECDRCGDGICRRCDTSGLCDECKATEEEEAEEEARLEAEEAEREAEEARRKEEEESNKELDDVHPEIY